jgi:hypothetical protein
MSVSVTACDQGGDDSFVASGNVISAQSGSTFDATAVLSLSRFGISFVLELRFMGTVGTNGQLVGSYTEAFSGANGFSSSGSGTFTGLLNSTQLSLVISGKDKDIEGETCHVSGRFSGLCANGNCAPTPIGQLQLPANVNLGSITVGSTAASTSVSIVNIGTASVTISSIGSSNAGEFPITSNSCATIAVGASCQVALAFRPSATGTRSGTITVVSSASGSPQSFNVSGIGTIAMPPPSPELVEYHHAAFDHYFVTGVADEITKLDNGTFVGWARTGYQFKAYPLGVLSGSAVCRFFSTSFSPKSSHFYTPFADECAIVKGNPNWQFEGEVFNIQVPATDGSCPVGTSPVYRLYNNGLGAAPNHRYTTDLSVRSQMLSLGWIAEGYGANGVIMCSPN